MGQFEPTHYPTGHGEFFLPDRLYESSSGVREALDAVQSGAKVVFVNGPAGTGKSRLIDYFRKMPGGNASVVVAPTGIAALQLDGLTVHSAFKLPGGVIDCSSLDTLPLDEVFVKAERIIIDEISMVRADVLDAIDHRLRCTRDDDAPFGNIQIIFLGDFFQLPPVMQDGDERILRELGYESPYALSAKVMQGIRLRMATLTKVWRQSDPKMIEVLSDIRVGRKIASAVRWLNENCCRPHRAQAEPLILTSRRENADEYNLQGIEALSGSADAPSNVWSFDAQIDGVFLHDAAPVPAPKVLTLRPGARVMAVKNDLSGRFVNGSLGTVMSCHPQGDDGSSGQVRVLFDGEESPVMVSAVRWRKTRQFWSDDRLAIVRENVGSFRQIPLVQGYAITVHKSQGLSLSDVRIDLGRGAFAPGQLYVALSRARSLEGLSLARPVSEEDIQLDGKLMSLLDWRRAGVSEAKL